MRRFTIAGWLLLALLLAACGTDQPAATADTVPDTPTPATEDATPTPELPDNPLPMDDLDDVSAFTASVGGAVTATVSGDGYFMCDDDVGELTIAPSGGFSDTILILLPRDAETGNYTFAEDANMGTGVRVQYLGADFTESYETGVVGTLMLEALPTAPGETVRGSFEFQADNSDGETITVNGSFDFEVGENAFANCGG